MRFSAKDVFERGKKEPSYWAERLLGKVRAEYEDMYHPTTSTGKPQDGELEDETMFSILYFLHEFGDEDLGRTLAYLMKVGKNKEESMIRIAHFFYHLGRKHERAFFK